MMNGSFFGKKTAFIRPVSYELINFTCVNGFVLPFILILKCDVFFLDIYSFTLLFGMHAARPVGQLPCILFLLFDIRIHLYSDDP